LKRFWTRKS